MRTYTADLKGALLKGGGVRLVQARPYMGTPTEQIYDIIGRIKQGYYPGADYVLFGTVSNIEFRQETMPLAIGHSTTATLSLDLVVDFNRFQSVFGNVFRFCGNDGNDVTLKEKFLGQRIRLRRILACENVRDTRHVARLCGIKLSHSRTRMRATEQLRKKHIRKPDSRRVLGLAGIARYRDFSERRAWLSNQVEILRWVPLPLFRNDFVVAFNKGIAREMSAAS